MFRFTYNNPTWQHDLNNIAVPGTEAEVLGPYCPRGEYTYKASFEALGLQE